MGKILNKLQKQMFSEYKEDAKEVLKIYNYLVKNTGRVWDSDWNVLVLTIAYKESDEQKWGYNHRYRVSPIGKIFLKGLCHETL